MNILYIGQLNPGGTCLDRMHALQRLGHDVTGFNVSPYQSPLRLLRSVQHRLQPKVLLQKMNADIQAKTRRLGGFDCAWIDKGVWIFPETVGFLKKQCGLTVHFTPDPQILFHKSRHFLSSVPLYDHLITTKSFEVELYKEIGAKSVLLSQQSYCPVRYANPVFDSRFSFGVGFIGHIEKHYAGAISCLAGEFSSIGVWGVKWKSAAKKYRIQPEIVKGAGLWGADYVNALASFRVGLGLLSKYIPEQHTTRTFEIPAAGSFLLAERTAEHQVFFEEGVEAEFFSAPEEMVSKAKFYLANEAARRRIATAGRDRCKSSGYDIDSVLHRALTMI